MPKICMMDAAVIMAATMMLITATGMEAEKIIKGHMVATIMVDTMIIVAAVIIKTVMGNIMSSRVVVTGAAIAIKSTTTGTIPIMTPIMATTIHTLADIRADSWESESAAETAITGRTTDITERYGAISASHCGIAPCSRFANRRSV